MDLIELEKWQWELDLENLEGFRHGTRQAPTLYRAGHIRVADGDAPMVFIASDEEPDRHGNILAVDGWDTNGFQKNPLFLWLHGMDDNHLLPIGRIPKIWPENKQLLAAVEWDTADPFANEVHGKYQRGFLKAVSVGFRPLEFEQIKSHDHEDHFLPKVKFLKQELLEVSAVPIPANPRTLQKIKGWQLTKRRLPAPIVEPQPDPPNPLAPIAKAMRELKEALRGPGGS